MPFESGSTFIHAFCISSQFLAEVGQPVTRWVALDQLASEILFKRRYVPVDRRLIDAQDFRRGERAPLAGHGQEVAQVVPVVHALVMQFCGLSAQACCSPTSSWLAINP